MHSDFSVLIGGNKTSTVRSGRKYVFLSGFATDTRLMGVVGMELTWLTKKIQSEDDPDDESRPEIYKQIFYLDCEERYIDTYYECFGEENAEIRRERIRLVSSLGGNPVPVSEKEARFLVQSYSGLNNPQRRLPEGASRYPFLLSPEQTLTQKEYDALSLRICGDIISPNYAVNYYLMRCASQDERGCAFLHGEARFPDPEQIRPSDQPLRSRDLLFTDSCTLYMNKITHSQDNADLYRCEALTERPGKGYFITNCSLSISDRPLRITQAEVISEFHITDIEAAMILKRSEFVSVCQIAEPDNRFRRAFAAFTTPFTETQYETGKLYIQFKQNNMHAGNSVYRLNDDMEALYYLTDKNQIVIMGYTSDEAGLAEFHLMSALFHYEIYNENRYEFPEPIFYEFINSDFDDFYEFLDCMTVDLDE